MTDAMTRRSFLKALAAVAAMPAIGATKPTLDLVQMRRAAWQQDETAQSLSVTTGTAGEIFEIVKQPCIGMATLVCEADKCPFEIQVMSISAMHDVIYTAEPGDAFKKPAHRFIDDWTIAFDGVACTPEHVHQFFHRHGGKPVALHVCCQDSNTFIIPFMFTAFAIEASQNSHTSFHVDGIVTGEIVVRSA